MKIIKASGEKETFNPAKLSRSIQRTGAAKQAVEETVRDVKKKIKTNASTEQIFRLTQSRLARYEPKAAIRYSLKKALFDLGPTGYPFEKYIAQVLQKYEYQTKTNQYIKGKCVSHEVDVLARKDGRMYFIECKYHNHGGGSSNIKVALYTYARYLDLKNSLDYWQDEKFSWLITNTRCSGDCLAYAECVGLKVTAWHYPENGGLEHLIEANEIYPITIFRGLGRHVIERLIEHNFILASDVLKRKGALKKTGLPKKIQTKLIEQATILFA